MQLVIFLGEIKNEIIAPVDWILEKSILNSLEKRSAETGMTVPEIVTDVKKTPVIKNKIKLK